MILKKIMMNCVVIDDNASAGAERWCHGRHDGSIDILLMAMMIDDVDGFVDVHIYYYKFQINCFFQRSKRDFQHRYEALRRNPC
jgi:hypothetical protein